MNYKTVFVVLILAVIAIWGYLRYKAADNTNSEFNQTTRYTLGRYAFARWALNLTRVGDAKGWYLAGPGPITIEVINERNTNLDEEGLQKFEQEVSRITGRQTQVVNVDTFESLGSLKSADLEQLVKNFRRHNSAGKSNLFVIYAKDFEGSSLGPAKAFSSFGIVVSDQKLRDLTSRYRQALRQYLSSVMLRQFGLQIGLSGQESASCIMNSEVQNPTNVLFFSGLTLPNEYCQSEIEEAKSIKVKF